MLQQAEKEYVRLPDSDMTSTLETMLAYERERLIRFCSHLTGNHNAAEDMAQETLLEAWKNRHKLGKPDALDPQCLRKWLSAIARNVCMRWRRNNSRDAGRLASFDTDDYEADFDIQDMIADDYDIEIELERDELAQLLDRALALLPPATRDVLIERYIHDSPHAEIAERLCLSEDAIVQRLYRGKLMLRRVISAQMSEEAAAYGLVVPDEERFQEQTRIWCPMCSKVRLTKYYDPTTDRTGFTCNCWHIASVTSVELATALSSPKSILSRQLDYLGNYYWQAINQLQITCPLCHNPAWVKICQSQDFPPEYIQAECPHYPGVHIFCPACGYSELNLLPHLTLDTPEARLFWRKHPKMLWLPGHEIEYNGQPALVSSFRDTMEHAQLDVIFQRDTLKVLGTREHSHP